MNNKVTIGSVSAGTLRDEDLLIAFADELERVTGSEQPFAPLIAEARGLVETGFTDGEASSNCLDAENVVCDLMSALSEYAPPHTYFGALDDDGADFGFWPTGEDFSDTCDIVRISDEEFIDIDCDVYVQVNDHGNITVSTLFCDGENHRLNGTNLCSAGQCLIAGIEIWSAV